MDNRRPLPLLRKHKKKIVRSKWQVFQVRALRIQIVAAAHSAGKLRASTSKALEVDHRQLMPLLRKPKKSNVPSKSQASLALVQRIQIVAVALPAG